MSTRPMICPAAPMLTPTISHALNAQTQTEAASATDASLLKTRPEEVAAVMRGEDGRYHSLIKGWNNSEAVVDQSTFEMLSQRVLSLNP